MASVNPTYGELIQMLEDAEEETQIHGESVTEILVSNFHEKYPSIPVGRPGRFHDTVKRIAGPTKTIIGLEGSPLRSYMKRVWYPRIRNTQHGCSPSFPSVLLDYGLTESTLKEALLLCSKALLCVEWSLEETPTIGFYRELHNFLKKWSVSRSLTKTTIGRLYTNIDPHFSEKVKSGRPDNVFRFVETVVVSKRPSLSPMIYGHERAIKRLHKEVCHYSKEAKELSSIVAEQQGELMKMKSEIDAARADCNETKIALEKVLRRLKVTERQRDKFYEKLKDTTDDFIHFEEDILSQNDDLQKVVHDLKSEIAALSSLGGVSLHGDGTEQSVTFCFKTKSGGKVYSSAIRELYYSLLVNQIPPNKIKTTIKAVLSCFFPSLKLETLQLPSESCAGYMRRHELTTISLAHKASTLIQAEHIHLNTDGTTKNQKKIGGVAANGMVISVNEVPDGTSKSMIEDISRELSKLRDIAKALEMPNAEKINWTLIVSSSSDSAASQKRFNRLVEEERSRDAETLGVACPDDFELVENFCAMHLGVNLRKAFLDGIRCFTCTEMTSRDHHPLDTFIYEFCKLFGKHGVPEYGVGVLGFPDFLEQTTDPNKASYYQMCARVKLERQVGSRYFVSASNAGKILYLREAALDYFVYTGRHEGNKLEQEVFRKLQDPDLLSQLKADAIMFHHVYSNLVILAKCTELGKSTFDMRYHYLELKMFFEEIGLHPETAMDMEVKVFASEERLYGPDAKFNHRLHTLYDAVEEIVFLNDNQNIMNPLISTGAIAMKEKLCKYAHAMLPGGKYWEPDSHIQSILSQLAPSNDLCESILGLNDYLTTAIPNLHQLSRSNLIQVKKNKTLQWFEHLPRVQQDVLVNLAVQRRKKVKEQSKEEEAARTLQRQEKMVQDKRKRDALQERAKKERERLSNLHLITNPTELQQVISEIDSDTLLSSKKKCEKKRGLIREQINIRRKVLRQSIKLPLTHKGRQRPMTDIIKELYDIIQANPIAESTCELSPDSLVGKGILHKFNLEGEEAWYSGHVVSYNSVTRLHEVAYDEEEENCFYNLLEDYSNGDLIIND